MKSKRRKETKTRENKNMRKKGERLARERSNETRDAFSTWINKGWILQDIARGGDNVSFFSKTDTRFSNMMIKNLNAQNYQVRVGVGD